MTPLGVDDDVSRWSSIFGVPHAISGESIESNQGVDFLAYFKTAHYVLSDAFSSAADGENIVSRNDSAPNVSHTSAESRNLPKDRIGHLPTAARIGSTIHRVYVTLHRIFPSQ